MAFKVYCPTCEKVVVLRRKNFDHAYHEILCFSVILTMGLGFILYYILKYRKKPNTCPNCESVFDLKTGSQISNKKNAGLKVRALRINPRI